MNINLKSKKPANMLRSKNKKLLKKRILQSCLYGSCHSNRCFSESSDQ